MAWSVTSRGTFDQEGTSDDWVSGSFTPAANSLLIVILHVNVKLLEIFMKIQRC